MTTFKRTIPEETERFQKLHDKAGEVALAILELKKLDDVGLFELVLGCIGDIEQEHFDAKDRGDKELISDVVRKLHDRLTKPVHSSLGSPFGLF